MSYCLLLLHSRTWRIHGLPRVLCLILVLLVDHIKMIFYRCLFVHFLQLYAPQNILIRANFIVNELEKLTR